MKRTIKITPINIPGQNASIFLDIVDSDLFHHKAKKIVVEKLKGINQDEFVFYSKSKNILVHEDDRVSKLFLNKDQNEIELYLTSYLIYQVVQGRQAGEGIIQQEKTNNNEKKLESEIKELKSEIIKLQNELQQQKIKHIDEQNEKLFKLENLQKINIEQLGKLEQLEKQNKQQLEQNVKYQDETNLKYKEILDTNFQLKIDLKKKEDQISEFGYEKKLIEKELEQHKIEIKTAKYEKEQLISAHKNQIEKINIEFEKIEKFYHEEKLQRNKDKEIISTFQNQYQEFQNKLQLKTEEMNQTRINTEYEIVRLRDDLKRSEEKCHQFKEQTIQQRKEILDQNKQINQIKSQNNEFQGNLNSQNQEINDLKKIIEEKQQELYMQDLHLKKITNSKDLQQTVMTQSEKDMQNLQQQLQNKIVSCNKLEKEIVQKSIEIEKLQKQLEIEINEKNEIIKREQSNIDKLMNHLKIEQDRLQIEEQKRAQLIKRIKENALRKVKDGKIISSTEAICKAYKNPSLFLQDKNIMTIEEVANVEIIRVDNNKAIQSLTKFDNPNITEFINRESVGNWKIKKSIPINGDGTKRKGFLMQVMQCDKNLYDNQVFIIKELDGFEKIVSIDKALYVAQNTLIAKVLAEHFQDKIQKASIKSPCKFTYYEPYLLNIKGNYYIAEKLITGNFIKLNDLNSSITKEQDVASYFYAFQMFTYQVTQKMLMVSNIQGNFNGSEYILCDPVISSPEGIMGDEDLAEPHILSIQDNYKKNPIICGKIYLQGSGYILLN